MVYRATNNIFNGIHTLQISYANLETLADMNVLKMRSK